MPVRRYKDARGWIYEARKTHAGPYTVMGRAEGMGTGDKGKPPRCGNTGSGKSKYASSVYQREGESARERRLLMLRVKEFREERGLAARDVIAVIREQYPGYDKYLNSKVECPGKYGVRLVNDAETLLEEAYVKTAPAARRPDRRRLPQRITMQAVKIEI